MPKKDIKDFSLKELQEAILARKQPAYRAAQIFRWLYQRGAGDFAQMSDIPSSLIGRLKETYTISRLSLREQLKSRDGTEKFLFQLSDGNFIESVLLYAAGRKTVCLSTQVGCRFACAFCASAAGGFIRNLTPSEITGQILFLEYELKHCLTNYVLMGMGEPLDNFKNVTQALAIITDSQGMNIGARRITLSTCGLSPQIEEFSRLGLEVNLSVSLHAANDKLRDMLMPVNKRYPLATLVKACSDYIKRTGRPITLEYVLIKGQNTSAQDIAALAKTASSLKAKVNLIPYSKVRRNDFSVPDAAELKVVMQELKKKGIKVTLRESKGKDIQAACGQLAGRKRE